LLYTTSHASAKVSGYSARGTYEEKIRSIVESTLWSWAVRKAAACKEVETLHPLYAVWWFILCITLQLPTSLGFPALERRGEPRSILPAI